MTAQRRYQPPESARLTIDQLPAMMKAERARRGWSMRQAAAEIGVHHGTITRVEQGASPDLASFLAIVTWLQVPVGWFVGEDGDRHQDAYRAGWEDCAAVVRTVMETTSEEKP